MKLKLLFALLIVQLSFAQQRSCGMEQYMQQIMANPVLRQEFIERQAKFEVELEKVESTMAANKDGNSTNSTNVLIRIPVAVHFPEIPASTPIGDKICLRDLAQSQINVINADYNAANADLSIWTGGVNTLYPGINIGNMNVQFEIATINHPAGTGLTNGNVAVTFGTDYLNGADSDPTWAGYMNFVVRDEGATTLGYSPLAGSPASGHTVVMNYFCFGTGTGCPDLGYVPQEPFHLGRTVTHELGHFFNLDHTFAGCTTAANCATAGDRVCDTPASNASTFGCPVAGSVLKCSGTRVLTMNYMDYVDDPCMYMFTAGQATRMIAYYNTISSQYKPNVLSNTEVVQNSFAIFPNPNNGSFSIQFNKSIGSYAIELFDVLGKTVYQNNFEQSASLTQEITIPNAAKGVYFVNVKTNEGIATKKIIIE
jgi:hypothetical protein